MDQEADPGRRDHQRHRMALEEACDEAFARPHQARSGRLADEIVHHSRHRELVLDAPDCIGQTGAAFGRFRLEVGEIAHHGFSESSVVSRLTESTVRFGTKLAAETRRLPMRTRITATTRRRPPTISAEIHFDPVRISSP